MRIAILDLVYVGLGGLIGSIGRYLASGAVHQIFPGVYFPIGTAVVNIIGCILIGSLTGLAELRNLLSPEMRMFLLIGLLGGFTTFSTFGIDTFDLLHAGAYGAAFSNVAAQLGIGLVAVAAGFAIGRTF